MDQPARNPIDRQLEALRVALGTLYAGRAIVEVQVRLDGIDRPVRVPFPVEVADQAPAAALVDAAEEGLPVLAQEILQVLRESGGGWMTGAEIAAAIGGECDHTSGTWKRAIPALKQQELIVTDQSRGYRLAPGRPQVGPRLAPGRHQRGPSDSARLS